MHASDLINVGNAETIKIHLNYKQNMSLKCTLSNEFKLGARENYQEKHSQQVLMRIELMTFCVLSRSDNHYTTRPAYTMKYPQ